MPSPRRAVVAVLCCLAASLATAGMALAGPLDLDPGFGAGGGILTTGDFQGGRWAALHVFGDGSFLAAGEVGNDRVAVERRTAAGALDPSFASDQPIPGLLAFGGGQGAVIPKELIVLGDGRILVAATALTAGGSDPGIVVARLTAAGHLDPSFGTAGIATVTTTAGGVTLGHMALQSTGKIILAGTHPVTANAGILARLTADGAVDSSFGSSGQVRVLLGAASTRLDDVAVDASDRLVATGWRTSGAANKGVLVVARFAAADGALDATYGVGGHPGYTAPDLDGAAPATYDVEGRRILLSADGHATVAATVRAPSAGAHLVGLARMTPNGALDPSFGTGGTTTQDVSPSHVTDVADLVARPGATGYLVAGRMTVGSTTQVALAGFHDDGSPDTTLNPGHTPTPNATNLAIGDGGDDEAYAVALTPAGRALIGGRVANTARDDGFLARVGGTASAPVASFTTTYAHTREGRPIRPGQAVTFDASASTDADGTVASYAWDLDGDGQIDHTGPTVTTSYGSPMSVGVLLKVTDNDNLTGTTGATLAVAANQAPGAAIIEPGVVPKAGKPFVLTAFAGDADGSVASYAWDLDGNGSYETSTGSDPKVTTKYDTAGQHLIGLRVTDDEGQSGTTADNLKVDEGPCVENPTIKIEKAVFITQGTAQAGAGCFHAVTVDKDGVRTVTYTTDGHFRLNGLEVDTLLSTKAIVVWKRKLVPVTVKGQQTYTVGATTAATLTAANVKVVGTYRSTDFAFIDGKIAWDIKGATIGGFKVDPGAGIGGLPLKVSGEPTLSADGTSTLDILPGTPPELLGKTPSSPMHATFGPAANASDLAPFSYTVDEIPLGVITLGPVVITYKGEGNWAISAKASMAVPVPTTLAGKLELAKGKVKMVDLQFDGAITVGPLLITHVGLTIDFGPKVTANPNCIKHVGLEDVTPYAQWALLDQLLPGYKAYVLAHDGPNQILFHQWFKDYKTPTFALCGSIGLSVAKVVEATFGFGFARYPSPLPNVFFFHGEGTVVELIHATIDAEITTEGYVHFNAEVKGGYPEDDPWIGWKLGLDFEYFKQQFNAEAYASITIVPLDFTAGARLLASNKGIVGCLSFDTVFGDWHPGGGAKWGHGPKLYFFGCDVNDYKVVIQHALSGDLVIGPPVHGMTAHAASVRRLPTTGRGNEATLLRYTGVSGTARAAQAAPDEIELPSGLPGTSLGFKGADAPPHVILHGPKGETIDSGSGNEPVHTPGVVAVKDPTTAITEIVLAKPSGGRWTVEVAADSSRLVEALQADGTKRAAVTGKVTGSGHRRLLSYSVRGLGDGQHVDFAEVGAAAGSIIGRVTKSGSGTLAFTPGDGAAGKRDVQAIVTTVDGYVNDRVKLGTYQAPAALRPAAAKRLTLKRAGGFLLISWPRDRLAKTTQVDVRSSNGLNVTRIVKTASTRLRTVPAGTTLRLTITGTSRTGVLGHPARFTRRLPAAKKHHAKSRKVRKLR